jgi:hypothetical protein
MLQKKILSHVALFLASPGVPSGLEMVIIKQEAPDGTFMEESQIFEIKEVKPETASESSEILQHPAPKSHKSQYRGKRLEGFSKCNYCEQFYQGKRAVYLRKKHEKEVHPKEFFQDCDEPHIECRYCGKIYEGSSRGRKAYLLHERKVCDFVFKLSKISFSNCQNFPFQTVKMSKF